MRAEVVVDVLAERLEASSMSDMSAWYTSSSRTVPRAVKAWHGTFSPSFCTGE
jgi:hypothetical protein